MKRFHAPSQKGFTLVELSIVMIIIGLLIGGILKGQELMANARINSVIGTYKQIDVAFQTFWDMYHALPGDLSAATNLIPGCSAATSCVNGNGNGNLGALVGAPWGNVDMSISSENTQFWKHLALADLIGGISPSASTVDWG